VLVSDTDSGTKSWPQGTVSVTTSGRGGSRGSPCALTQVSSTSTSSCSVTYSPTVVGSGTHTVKASYTASDSVHAASSDATGFGLTVTSRSSSTSVTGCSPSSVSLHDSLPFSVLVSDTDSGTKSWPQGTV